MKPSIIDRLEQLLHEMREITGRAGRVNDPVTIRLAQFIVQLRDEEAA